MQNVLIAHYAVTGRLSSLHEVFPGYGPAVGTTLLACHPPEADPFYLPFPALLLRRSRHSAITGVLYFFNGNYNLLWLLLRANINYTEADCCGFALIAAPFHTFRPEAFVTLEPFSGDS
jgi:hypothetical protein